VDFSIAISWLILNATFVTPLRIKLVGSAKLWLGAYTTLWLTARLAADKEPRALPVRGRRYTLDFTPSNQSSFYACTMPRFIRRRHRLRDGQNFLSDTVPTDYTFDRLASKLKEFRASTDKLRLVHSSTPMPTHWARQREAAAGFCGGGAGGGSGRAGA
jgi:hypothetical protein